LKTLRLDRKFAATFSLAAIAVGNWMLDAKDEIFGDEMIIMRLLAY
jgi:hypothetical protein